MIYDFKVMDNKGDEISLDIYKGKVLLIVNTATNCGLTPHYKGLQDLYDKYSSKGFEILDFPCNQFLAQAPGNDAEINEFCTLNYKTTFKRFMKIDVNGDNTHPLFTYLKNSSPEDFPCDNTPALLEKLKNMGQTLLGNSIKWNFTKFLVDKNGNVIKRYSPATSPENIEKDIEILL